MGTMVVWWLLLGLALVGVSAADDDACDFRQELDEISNKETTDGKKEYHWGGFKCEELRCDPATETLWLKEGGRVFLDRDKYVKGHTITKRSQCMVLAVDGRNARYAQWKYRERRENFGFHESFNEAWSDVGPLNATSASNVLVNSTAGAATHAGCLAFCKATCAELGAGDAETFASLYEATLGSAASPLEYPATCFGEGRQGFYSPGAGWWVSDANGAYMGMMYALFLVPIFMAWCVSMRCCALYVPLNRLRNEFSDSCPCAARCLHLVFDSTFKRFKKCRAACVKPCRKQPRKHVVPEQLELIIVQTEDVVTSQPGTEAEAVEQDAAAPASLKRKERALIAQMRLMLWKIFLTKSRHPLDVVKQLALPPALFLVLWLLYLTLGMSGFAPPSRWSKQNDNFETNPDLRGYERGAVLSHNFLEPLVANCAYISFMQVVMVGIVMEQQAKLVEAMKMAGLRGSVYWIAMFCAEASVAFGMSVLVACMGTFGLFNSVGHAASPFGTLLGLTFCYSLALIAICFAASALISNAEAASLFSLAAQTVTTAAYYVGAPLTRDGETVAASVFAHSPKVQRWFALIPQMAYTLVLDSFQSHRKHKCRLHVSVQPEYTAGSTAEDASWESFKYGCSGNQDEFGDAPSSRLVQAETFANSYGTSCVSYGSYSYSYEHLPSAQCLETSWSEFPAFYTTERDADFGQGPGATRQWMASIHGMLILDCLLFLALAWYLQQIVPREFGVNRPWYFLVTRDFWCGSRARVREESEEEVSEASSLASDDLTAVLEPGRKGATIAVSVRNLKKSFGDFRAVKGVSFDMVESEIFCLLGHNGAGKTTTISMLSGLIAPDAATQRSKCRADVYGHDILSAAGMEHLRTTLGVCPQHDVLFPSLTLREHVYFFSRLKGTSQHDAIRDADNLLAVFHLSERSEHLGSELSGGQKRKLSTSIALAGSSRFIVCDEPTAGMDPVARRELWTLLRAVRTKRALLLTTHHMDEAEALGDRVAIMASGTIKADGSIPFLKRRFGDGYRLEVQLATPPDAADEDYATLDAAVRSVSRKATVAPATTAQQLASDEQDAAAARDEDGACSPLVQYAAVTRPEPARAYLLPFSDEPFFADLFEKLDGDSVALKVQDYSLSQTTLEDVFLTVGEDATAHNVLAVSHSKDGTDSNLYSRPLREPLAEPKKGDSFRKFARHVAAVARLRVRLALNDLKVLLLPVRLLEGAVFQILDAARPRPKERVRPLATKLGSHPGGARATAVAVVPGFTAVVMAILAKNDKIGTSSQPKWDPLVVVLIAIAIAFVYVLVPGLLAAPLVQERKLRLRNLLSISGLDARAYWAGTCLGDLALLSVSVVVTWIAVGACHTSYRVQQSGFDYEALTAPNWYVVNGTDFEDFFQDRGDLLDWACETLGDNFCADESYERREWLTQTPWLWVILPVFALALSSFAHAGASGFEEPTVCVGAFPVISIALIVGPLVLSFVLALALGGLVKANETIQLFNWNFGEILSAFGWLASWASPPGALFMFLMRLTENAYITTRGDAAKDDPVWPAMWASLLVLLTQICVFEACAYVKDRVATRPLAFCATRLSAARRDRLDCDVLAERERVLALIEPGTAARTGSAPACVDASSASKNVPVENVPARRPTPRFAAGFFKFCADAVTALRDELPEESRAPAVRGDCSDAELEGLLVLSLRKVYAPKRHGARAVEAVQNLTFSARAGEVFGLLGANGAGKSTAMSMIMRATEPTSGDAKVGGHSILSSFARAAEHLGVVNQTNTLWPTLSCRDHLRLFARVRAKKSTASSKRCNDAIERLTEAALKQVELLAHADKMAGRLSGGMKRKLCCAAALVGDPRVVLLDEPSAGLDPVSQRNLWQLVKATMKGRAVVLTTHSMLEADVLCDRIGIMAKGQLVCLGTPRSLKRKYADGYELVVKLDDAAVRTSLEHAAACASLTDFVHTISPSAVLSAADAGVLTYDLDSASADAAQQRGLLARVFRAFDEAARARLRVAELNVAPATIEKVFIRIVSGKQDSLIGDDDEVATGPRRDARLLADELQRHDQDDELDGITFFEKTCCGCSRFAHAALAKWNCLFCFTACCHIGLALLGAPFPWFANTLYVCFVSCSTVIINAVSLNFCVPKPPAAD